MLRIIKFLAPLTITILILYFLFSRINREEIKNVFLQSHKLIFILAVLIFFLPTFISALRWKTIMKITGYDINYKTALAVYLTNIPIAKISPLNSGDFARAFYFRNTIPISKNLGVIFLENVLDFMFVSFLVVVGGLVLKIKMAAIIGAVIFLLGLSFLFFITKIKPNIREDWKIKLENFRDIFKIFLKSPSSFLLVIFYSLLSLTLILICFKLLFLSFGLNLSFLKIIITQPIAIFFGLVPITLSGMGIRESVMVYLYRQFAPVSSIVAVGLSYSFLAAILLPLLCLPFLFKILWKQTAKNQNYQL
jgi:glycosyltransferase 2 family protein